MGEKRKYRRITASLPLHCTILPERKIVFNTISKNLSSVGLKILCRDFLSAGNTLKLNINLINGAAELKAQVIWCNKRPYSDDYYVGLELIEVEQKDQGILDNFIDEVGHQ